MSQQYRDRAAFFVIYIREAHPTDGRQAPRNVRDNVLIKSPQSIQERQIIAGECAKSLNINFPVLLDNINDDVERVYAGWPDRIYVIDQEGKVALKGAMGPSGFRPEQVPPTLDRLLGQSPSPASTPGTPPERPGFSQRPGFGDPGPEMMKERLGTMLSRMGVSDAGRLTTVSSWQKKMEAFRPVMDARQRLMMTVRENNDEAAARALTAYEDSQKAYAKTVEELDRAIEDATGFSQKPQLKAVLIGMGVIGLNLAPPMQQR